MITNLFKSVFFHIFVVITLITISKLMTFSKTNEVTEIPIEILEISDKTSSKKIESKPKPKPKPKQNVQNKFSAPIPLSKPKVPEFVEKKIDERPKKKNKEKSKSEQKRLESILKSIDEIKIKKNLEKTNTKTTKNNEEKTKFDEKLTISELDMIRRQFISCWNIPAGAKNIESLRVLVKISLDEEGNVISSKLVKTNNLNNPFYRAASESALRAVRHPSCKKLKVPEKKYKIWKNITLNFDPSMISR